MQFTKKNEFIRTAGMIKGMDLEYRIMNTKEFILH